MIALARSTVGFLLLACGSTPPPSDPSESSAAANENDPCAQKTPEQCLPIALEYSRVGSAGANTPLAAQLLARGCDANHAASCANLSFLYLTGTGVPENSDTSFQLRDKACELKDAESCYFAARGLNNGLLGVLMGGEEPPPDFEQLLPATRLDIKAYLQKACELGHAESCTSLETGSAEDSMPWQLPEEAAPAQ